MTRWWSTRISARPLRTGDNRLYPPCPRSAERHATARLALSLHLRPRFKHCSLSWSVVQQCQSRILRVAYNSTSFCFLLQQASRICNLWNVVDPHLSCVKSRLTKSRQGRGVIDAIMYLKCRFHFLWFLY